MELIQKKIQMLQKKSEAVNQMTFDEDFNVPDVKPDIYRMIQKKGDIHMEEVQVIEGKARIRGFLHFHLLYVADTPQHQVCSLEGKLTIDENLFLKDVESGDKVSIKWKLEDLSLHIINSRKLNVKAIVEFSASVDELVQIPFPIQWKGDLEVSEKHRKISMTSLGVHKKDTLRKKEEFTLPSNMPNIREILWSDLEVRGMETRANDGKVSVKGEVFLFLLYAEDEANPLQWLERVVPFSGEINCVGSKADMIPYIDMALTQTNLEVKPDVDGEERTIQMDWVLELDMKLYQENSEQLLSDVYTPLKECALERKTHTLEHLLIKNDAKCRIHDRVPIQEAQGKILQICHSEGSVNIDRVEMVENGMKVDGILALRILYCISDDEMPFYSVESAIPFSRTIEADGIGKDCVYQMQAGIDQLATAMLDSNEIEVRAILNLDVVVLRQWKERLITQITEHDLDMEMLEKMPGIVCYIVQPQDSLWDVAKKFYTTVEEIKKMNELGEEEPEALKPLLIVKKTDTI